MEVLNNLAFGFSRTAHAAQPDVLCRRLHSRHLGGLVARPGPPGHINLLLPLTYSIDTTGALIMLAGIYWRAIRR